MNALYIWKFCVNHVLREFFIDPTVYIFVVLMFLRLRDCFLWDCLERLWDCFRERLWCVCFMRDYFLNVYFFREIVFYERLFLYIFINKSVSTCFCSDKWSRNRIKCVFSKYFIVILTKKLWWDGQIAAPHKLDYHKVKSGVDILYWHFCLP